MTEESKKLKNIRKSKLSSFTRKLKSIQGLLGGSPSQGELREALEEVKLAFKELEKSDENFTATLEDDELNQEEGYLDTPSNSLDTIKKNVADRIKSLDLAEKHNEAQRNLLHGINSFGTPSLMITNLSSAKEICVADMRVELDKIEKEYDKIKNQIMYIDSSVDQTAILDQFKEKVTDEFERCKKIGLKYMNSFSSAIPERTEARGTDTATVSGSYSTTKRETVMLPHFSGEEKTAYLKYPIWKLQWDSHIQEYEEKYRATMLMNHLDEKAQLQIVGLENKYEEAMKQLDTYYSDAKKIVRACLDEIRSQPQVSAYDYKGLVSYKKCIINNYSRLAASDLSHEMSNTAAMGVLIRKFPIQEAVEWQKFLSKQDKAEQSRPFPAFIRWLEDAGSSWELLAASGTGIKGKSGAVQVHHTFYGEESGETSKSDKKCFRCGKEGHMKKDCTQKDTKGNGGGAGRNNGSSSKAGDNRKPRNPPKHRKYHCAFHKDTANRFCSTWSCPSLKYLPYGDRIKLLRENMDCEVCCGDCPKGNCQAKSKRVCGGSKEGRGCGVNHVGHELWCAKAKLCFTINQEVVLRSQDDEDDGVLLQLMKIPGSGHDAATETVLWDSACTGLFVRNEHAVRMNFESKERRLRVCTLGGEVKEIDGTIFECYITDLKGEKHYFSAHGLDEITGALNTMLGEDLMRKLFPSVIGAQRMCVAGPVDYLIGLSKASWQPQRTIKAEGGGDFWIWENGFGSCIGGSHPWVGNYISRSDNLYTVLKVVETESIYTESLKIPTCSSYQVKTSVADAEDFFRCEQLGTLVDPKCGSCRCGRCPVPGSRYSFKEETELKLIDENLRYDSDNGAWVASYPFLHPRESLKGNKSVALKSMQATERTLAKNVNWGETYKSQIQDMVDRGAARVVSEQELAEYTGHVNYLPHLAVVNPKSDSTPVRICFDASRPQGGGPSLNAVLAKGPDCFLNNLASVIIRFRDGVIGIKGDVAKMYNSVLLEREDAFLQCFLWRDLDLSAEPTTYQVVVNNIGVKPAGCIATLSLYKSSNLHEQKYPETVRQLKGNSYVDDLGLTAGDKESALKRIAEANEILKHANMKIKKWIMTGDAAEKMDVGNIAGNLSLEESGLERMLGIVWNPTRDVFQFNVRINLSALKKKSRLGPDISKIELLQNPPKVITRRQYYSQIQSLFDPLGLLSPVLLTAKLLLRKTWENGCEKLGWDDALPEDLVAEIVDFFVELFELENIEFPRSLLPQDQDVIGKPDLIVFSDGSVSAFGSVCYIRWKLSNGGWWSRIILSKSKIAPKSRLTVPRLELNVALLSKRLDEFVQGALDVEFGEVYHMVDSSTVLGYVHKLDSKLKPYEGIRVSEIQAAGKMVNGRLHGWSWVDGESNPADWATKPRKVADLKHDGFWQKGPWFLEMDVAQWPIRLDFRTDTLDGELQPKKILLAFYVSEEMCGVMESLLNRLSSSRKLFQVLGYMYKWRSSVLKETNTASENILTVEVMSKARNVWIKFAQRTIDSDIRMSVKSREHVKIHGRFARLSPFIDSDGIWRVGLRLREFTPFTQDHKPPAILPRKNRLTYLLMKDAHDKKHSGVTETVAQFRMLGYWSVRANEIAKLIKKNCVTCRYLDHHPIGQQMGCLSKEMLVNPVAWEDVELDLFGPILCRSDVNKRVSKKVWGMVIVDSNSSALHCDVVLDYSTEEVLKTLRRFGSLRGWPVRIRSDPGSQLEGAAGVLSSWWEDLKKELTSPEHDRGFSWLISPADSPWRQGRSEVSVKIVKKLLKIAVGNIKLTPTELQTALFEVADLCNQRPIGLNKVPEADGKFKVLTPNCLLMGRTSSAVPNDSAIPIHMKKRERYLLIQQVTRDFWERWVAEVTPMKVVRQKWHETSRNLTPGDIVLVHDVNAIKGSYKLAKVISVKMSADGLVRSGIVQYRIPYEKDKKSEYTGGKLISLSRSVQRLTLILAVEELDHDVIVNNGSVVMNPEVNAV